MYIFGGISIKNGLIGYFVHHCSMVLKLVVAFFTPCAVIGSLPLTLSGNTAIPFDAYSIAASKNWLLIVVIPFICDREARRIINLKTFCIIPFCLASRNAPFMQTESGLGMLKKEKKILKKICEISYLPAL